MRCSKHYSLPIRLTHTPTRCRVQAWNFQEFRSDGVVEFEGAIFHEYVWEPGSDQPTSSYDRRYHHHARTNFGSVTDGDWPDNGSERADSNIVSEDRTFSECISTVGRRQNWLQSQAYNVSPRPAHPRRIIPVGSHPDAWAVNSARELYPRGSCVLTWNGAALGDDVLRLATQPQRCSGPTPVTGLATARTVLGSEVNAAPAAAGVVARVKTAAAALAIDPALHQL